LSFFFFFSSRRRHTRFSRDWSSDVCSSDLPAPPVGGTGRSIASVGILPGKDAADPYGTPCRAGPGRPGGRAWPRGLAGDVRSLRSEERRVGKECGCRWATVHEGWTSELVEC